MAILTCPHCNHQGTAAKTIPTGTKVRCPHCHASFIPADPEPAPDVFPIPDPPRAAEPLPLAVATRPPPLIPTPVSSPKPVRTASEEAVRCPKCGSTQLSADKKGFGLGKALVGGVLTGGVGLLAGFIGSRKVLVTCLKCGNQWQPGSQEEADQRAAGNAAAQDRAAQDKQRAADLMAEQARRERALEHEERLRERREAREKFYRSRGVEPGPFAWFKVWPDWLQFVSIGLLVSLPLVVVLVLIIHPR